MSKLQIDFGALAPPIDVQLHMIGLCADKGAIERIQSDANAVTSLSIRGVMTESMAHACRRKLIRMLARCVKVRT